MRVWKQTLIFILSLVATVILLPVAVSASCASGAQTCSTSYQVNEAFFGAGGQLNTCSTNYCSKQSAGETTVGNTASTNYQAQGGFNTDRYPYLQFTVNNVTINLGTLTTTATQTATASFSVKAYLAHGYTVINASDPPSNDSYTMQTLTTPTASSSGTEQFGINLVSNTSPTTFGSDPTQVPNNTFGFGQVASSYSNHNLFKYVKGDTVAFSNQSTSYTDYTVSYIFNVSNVTPGGTYVFNHVLVATATY